MSQDRIQIKESNDAASMQDIGIKTSILCNQSKKSSQISETNGFFRPDSSSLLPAAKLLSLKERKKKKKKTLKKEGGKEE